MDPLVCRCCRCWPAAAGMHVAAVLVLACAVAVALLLLLLLLLPSL